MLIYIHDVILAGAQANGFGMVDGVGAVLLVNAVQQVGGIVGGGNLLLIDDTSSI